jgi:AraC family transcriptional regulator of adaptative response/methylated-DNA-[protein]-cysteine methyltransferase
MNSSPVVSCADHEACWQALSRRDQASETSFFYAVSTTGVYCRPTCSARRPRRENVSFYGSCDAAERAGFRACKRCLPNQPTARERRAVMVREACRAIERADSAPSLAALAEAAGLSRFHFQRAFKAETGLTPKSYAAGLRAERARGELATGRSVGAAIYGAGFGSSGRFYEDMGARLGMTPTTYRAGGRDLTIRFTVTTCSLGALLIAATERGVCAIELGDDPARLTSGLRERFARASFIATDAEFEAWVRLVIRCVEAPELGTSLPLDIRGTVFQQRVFRALLEIPLGSTTTYAELARAIGAPRAARAVGRACGSNGLAVVVPCHRVLHGDGTLSGYRWGVERKRALLEREAAYRQPVQQHGEPAVEARPFLLVRPRARFDRARQQEAAETEPLAAGTAAAPR